jgi:hypothetical protein
LVLTSALFALALNNAMAQGAPAASTGTEYKPSSGQQGKDVIWVPTPQALVDRMLDLAKVNKRDYLIDLGSGDGRTVITAAKRGIRAHGIEYNADMVMLAKRNADAQGVAGTATFERADIFESDFSKASVVTLFLLSSLNVKLRPTILEMRPGTRIVSNTFDMGDWQPDAQINAGGNCSAWCRAFKWVVPAKVEGTWRMADGELRLTQTYQMLSGELSSAGRSVPITNAKMNGTRISFTSAGRRYTGEVENNRISGQIEGRRKWYATLHSR